MIKRIKDLLIIFIVFLICFSFINQVFLVNVLAQGNETPEEEDGVPTTLLGKLLYRLGNVYAKLFAPIIQVFLEAPQAKPTFVEVGYEENVSFEAGFLNLSSGEFEVWEIETTLFNVRYLNFEIIEYPGGNTQSTWTVSFDPNTILVKKGTVIKTNVSVALTSPPVLSNAIQSGVLKLRIYDTWAYGNLWSPPKGTSMDNLLGKFFWFISAVMGHWGQLSGTVGVDVYDVEILVKVKPYHAVKFDSVPYLQFEPNKIVSVPITLQNMGNYNDTYSFRVISDNDDIKISDPISITLAPGETKNTYLGIAIPPNAFDYGTLHKIKIEAFSIDQPNTTIAERTVYFETKGLYVSEMGFIVLIFFIFIIFAGVYLFIYRRRLSLGQYCVKPDKPWDIPKEKEYLEKLKKEDPDKYKEVMKMMEDEYESALLWYKYYCESIIKSKQRQKEKIIEEKLKKRKREEGKVEKPIKKEVKTIEEIKPEEYKKIVKEELLIDKKLEAEKLRKERVLLNIRRDQEKQRKKLSESSLGKGG